MDEVETIELERIYEIEKQCTIDFNYNRRVQGIHFPPKYYAYTNLYADVTRCTSCFQVALSEDQKPMIPCRHCGGSVMDYANAIWVFPVYKGWLFWRKVIQKGYWQVREGSIKPEAEEWFGWN